MASNKFDTDDQYEDLEPGSERQWWLTAGPESCFACEGSTHAEGLAYCVACDQAICALCSQESSELGGVLCPECVAEAGEDEH